MGPRKAPGGFATPFQRHASLIKQLEIRTSLRIATVDELLRYSPFHETMVVPRQSALGDCETGAPTEAHSKMEAVPGGAEARRAPDRAGTLRRTQLAVTPLPYHTRLPAIFKRACHGEKKSISILQIFFPFLLWPAGFRTFTRAI